MLGRGWALGHEACKLSASIWTVGTVAAPPSLWGLDTLTRVGAEWRLALVVPDGAEHRVLP